MQVSIRIEKVRHVVAHPESALGNFDYAESCGYRLLAVKPDGLLIYRKKTWLEKLLRL